MDECQSAYPVTVIAPAIRFGVAAIRNPVLGYAGGFNNEGYGRFANVELNNNQVHHLPSAARNLKLKGVGDGSAFRSHPCWVRRGQFLIVDHWRTDRQCHISLITAPDAVVRAGSNDSFGHGNPFPLVDKGELVTIWHTGRWTMEGPWKDDVLAMVEALEVEVKEASQRRESEQAAKQQRLSQEKLAREEAIRQQYQQSSK